MGELKPGWVSWAASDPEESWPPGRGGRAGDGCCDWSAGLAGRGGVEEYMLSWDVILRRSGGWDDKAWDCAVVVLKDVRAGLC